MCRPDQEDGNALCEHGVSLTEPSKLLQGLLIDGIGVTQPEDVSQRQSLFDVVTRLLQITPLCAANSNSELTLTTHTQVQKALKERVSPQFKWNTQTTLWECLVQIGAVIDSIPRLISNAQGKYTVVTFDFVNAYTDVVESIEDEYTNVAGQNIDENQYNTALSSVVENLKEE